MSDLPNGNYLQTDGTDYMDLWSNPVLSLNGSTGNGIYTSGGIITYLSDTTNFTEILLSAVVQSTNPCDLTSDGIVDQQDINLAIDDYFKGSACNNISGGGSCTVVDLQRIINAKNGLGCNVGQ